MNDMAIQRWALAALIGSIGFGHIGAAFAQSKIEPTGAALMYEAYCTACHDAQVHWREHKLAADWPSLVAQVRRWQGTTGLQWSEQDIEAVARYLNDRYYHYPLPG